MKRFFIFLLLTCVGVARADAASKPGTKKPVAKGTLVSASAERDAELKRLTRELGTDKDALMKAAAQKPTAVSNTGEQPKPSKSQRRRQKARDKKAAASGVLDTGSDVEGDSDTSPAPVPVVHTQPRGAPRGEPRPTLPVTASVTGTKSALPPPRGIPGGRPPVTASPPRGVPAPMGTGSLFPTVSGPKVPPPPPGLQMGRSPARPVWPKPHGSDQLGDTDTFPPIPTATHGASPRPRYLTQHVKGQAAVKPTTLVSSHSPVHSVDTDEGDDSEGSGDGKPAAQAAVQTTGLPPSVKEVVESVLSDDEMDQSGSGDEDAASEGDDFTAPRGTLVDVKASAQFGFGSPFSHRSRHSRSDSVAFTDDALAGLVDDADDFGAGKDALKPANKPVVTAVDVTAIVTGQQPSHYVAASGFVSNDEEEDSNVPDNTLFKWFDDTYTTRVILTDTLKADAWSIPVNALTPSHFSALLNKSGVDLGTTPESLQVVYLASRADSPQAKTTGLSILGGSVYGISERPMNADEFKLTLVSLYSLVKSIEADDIFAAIYADHSLSKQNHAEHRHNMLLCALAVKADVDQVFGDSRMATIAGWAHGTAADIERDLSALETRFDMPGHLVIGTKFPSTMEDVD